ncbi:MAG: peptidylprolyl isomerase [Acidobacteriota bacterium]
MIRFLQTDNRLVKALLVVVIGAASVSMVVYLIPGLAAGSAVSPDTYAVVYPHWYSRFLSSGDEVSQAKVEQIARQQIQQRNPQYADNPILLNIFEQQVGQQLVQQQVLLQEAARLGISASDEDVRNYLHTGSIGQVLFPDGKFIGQDQYASLIADRLNMSVKDFEDGVKQDIVLRRLQALVTAGVTVNPQDVRDTYRKQNVKIKFDYAVLTSQDVANSINPSDAELQAFFKKNAARYANAVPEARTISYFSFTPEQLPGGVPQPTQQEIQAYYNQHQSDYQVPEQAKARHILISVAPNADAQTDAAAKAKAEMVLKQLQSGGNWTEVAKKYSDDPGSKNSGGELGWAKRGMMVPAFDTAIFTQKIGEIAIVKSQFGYHVVQVEDRQTAHTQALNEVLPQIQATLIRQSTAEAEQNYASTLTAEAAKNGLAKTAEAHHLQVVTTPPVARTGVIAALPDSSQILTKAFAAKPGDAPQDAPTGEGYAVFQVTGVQPAHAPDFADWKTHVLDDYRQEQLPALLAEKTKELDEKAKNMNDLAKAAKAVGAKMESSDLVSPTGQVPDLGSVGQVAPQLFDLSVGAISAPINTGQSGVVAKIVDKQEPTPDDIAKNFDATRDQLLDQQRQQAFSVFLSNLWDNYRKHNLVRINAKPNGPQAPGM